MNVARILYPVKVLGPGNRVGIWVAGCERACPGCSNPELWKQQPEYEISLSHMVEIITSLAKNHPIDGFTISGGEPMLQAQELAVLLEELKGISRDVLVYSGFRLEELQAKKDDSINCFLSQISVLIDGAYIEEKNDNSVLRGSSNQRIHILEKEFEHQYREYFSKATNQIQNFTTTDGIVSVGIHRRSF